jgi:hypothetical protein
MLGFVLNHKGKPAPPVETVTVELHPVLCGCGTKSFTVTLASGPG